MGGIGSGRRAGFGCMTVEDCRALDVSRLHREGCLQPGWQGLWQWTRDGEVVASIQLKAGTEGLSLAYSWRIGDDAWQPVRETVPIERLPCRFGGSRPYFRCPGLVDGNACDRRVVKLYAAGRYHLCRHCYRLTYGSQREDRLDRAQRQADRLRRRLGGEAGFDAPLPRRPKGMWRRTYDRLIDEILQTEDQVEAAFGSRCLWLHQRLKREEF
ncbi:MAG: hypothetical protein RIC87_08160 [Kiloniellales bacterium]